MRKIEELIARAFIKSAIAAGYKVSVSDGDEFVLRDSTDEEAVISAMFSTDEDILYVDLPEKQGWVRFIYGNSGWDVISDYTTNIQDLMVEADKISEEYQ